jgi:hypothetical protein
VHQCEMWAGWQPIPAINRCGTDRTGAVALYQPARRISRPPCGETSEMNEHESVRKLLPLAAAGALEFKELRRVEQHAHACESCSHEMETWKRYAHALRQLPQVSVPPGLLERTHRRILQYGVAPGDRANGILLGAIAIFGWAAGLTLWVLARGLTGGVVNILGMNLVSPPSCLLLSAVLTWITALASAVAFVRHSDTRSTL